MGRGAGQGIWPTQALLRHAPAAGRFALQGLPCGAPAPARGHAPPGLHALQPKAFTPPTTDSTHGLRCAPSRLLHQPKPTQANQVWVSDSTYLPLANGDWAYLCAYQALRSQSRRGDCYDNAQAESLWSRLETEVLKLRERLIFADLADAQVNVADYFGYYNHERLHSGIDY